MHIGHRALMHRLEKRSRSGHARVLVTYSPHPDVVLGKADGNRRHEIFTYEEKLSLLQDFDLDASIFLPFSKELARMTARHYLEAVLLEKLKAKHIIIGYDQTFGQGKEGDFAFLKKNARQYGYRVDRLPAVKFHGNIVSSTLIREYLLDGKIKNANQLLGHDFFISGTVVRGNRRGHTMGYPTANLDFSDTKVVPREGVYIGYVKMGDKKIRAMINIGKNPTFDLKYLSLEVHLLDFEADLYGQHLRVHFEDRIRDEIKFNGIDALKSQLDRDAAIAREGIKPESDWTRVFRFRRQ